jgi:Fic family protein
LIEKRAMERAKDNVKKTSGRGEESVALMEPMTVSEGNPARREIDDLAFQLNQDASRLAGRLAPAVAASIGDLVRSMNCYYSNLIEGHDTHPIEIERALAEDFSADPKKRDLQKEAVAHIKVQEWIDVGGDVAVQGVAALLSEIHRLFYEQLPESFLWLELPSKKKVRIVPGSWRDLDVAVGRHIPISATAIPRFIKRWQEAYALSPARLLSELGAMHHRLVWIHPFADGNGRASRLLIHAILRRIGVGSPLWAVSRGLARNVERYKALLQAADEPRRGDLDGRGSLSEAALADFNRFFLEQALDQVSFMNNLIEIDRLLSRILLHVREEIAIKNLDEGAEKVMRALFQSGELPRGEVEALLGSSPRTRTRILKGLFDLKMIQADSHRAPVRLFFSAENAERWMPGLFPPKRSS